MKKRDKKSTREAILRTAGKWRRMWFVLFFCIGLMSFMSCAKRSQDVLAPQGAEINGARERETAEESLQQQTLEEPRYDTIEAKTAECLPETFVEMDVSSPIVLSWQPALYDGDDVVIVNDGIPGFSEEDWEIKEVRLSPLDEHGRCGPVMMVVSTDRLRSDERGETGQAKPSGWHQSRYPEIIGEDPPMLYQRSHLLMWRMSGLTSDPRNLITGTKHLNKDLMLECELAVVRYIETTGDMVLYRVTPVFENDNLLATGVLMDAESYKEGGISYCIFLYNVQPGVEINYATGENRLADPGQEEGEEKQETQDYILNTRSGKIHYPWCESVSEMKEQNKQLINDTVEHLQEMGYTPCGACKP